MIAIKLQFHSLKMLIWRNNVMFFSVSFKRKVSQLALLAFVVVLGVFGYLAIMDPALPAAIPAATEERQVPIYSVDTEEDKLAISFDAAWGA